jgi:hypothetical protein
MAESQNGNSCLIAVVMLIQYVIIKVFNGECFEKWTIKDLTFFLASIELIK